MNVCAAVSFGNRGVPLIGAGVGHRRDIHGGDVYGIGYAVQRAIVDDELRRIGAGAVDGKGRVHAGETRQDRGAAGRRLSDQLYVSGSPLASELPLPFKVMVDPGVLPPWSGPALATGATFMVEMFTVLGALFTVPSLTMSCAT